MFVAGLSRMFDISPFRTNSKASRYLLYSLPVKQYWFGEEHVNLSLQSLMEAVVKDLNDLATSGLEVDGKATWFGTIPVHFLHFG